MCLCANFVAARQQTYPTEVLTVLTDLGINYSKEADLYQQDVNDELGTVLYRWWFYCIGCIEEGPQAWEYLEYKPDDILPSEFWDKHLETLRPSPQYLESDSLTVRGGVIGKNNSCRKIWRLTASCRWNSMRRSHGY